MESTKAGVQYDDLTGTVAADLLDDAFIDTKFRELGRLQETDFLIGVRLYLGEYHGGTLPQPRIAAIVAEASSYDTLANKLERGERPGLRHIEIDMTHEDFQNLFKRFEMVLLKRGLPLSEYEYHVED